MKFYAMAHSAGDDRHPLTVPFVISLMGHLILFAIILHTPRSNPDYDIMTSVIDVQMVEIPAGQSISTSDAGPVPEKVETKEEAPAAKVSTKDSPEAEVSIAKPQPKKKTSLKYQTLKSQRVLKNALERLEKKVETSPPKPLEDTFKRLRDKVEKEGPPKGVQEGQEGSAEATGKTEGFGVGSKKEGELIDLYMLEVAYAINKNWAFSQQLAGDEDNLIAKLSFKVMSDGRIEDISFTDRSGNTVLDESALKAIVKSSPVKPLPPEINRPYIIMGIAFTPKGVY